jgi:hypothetical protein
LLVSPCNAGVGHIPGNPYRNSDIYRPDAEVCGGNAYLANSTDTVMQLAGPIAGNG